jgi:SynChlorMet cassette protein ScmD
MNRENIGVVANPLVVFREDFDDWAILFDPDTGKGFAINPVSAFIWKRLDGQHSAEDIAKEMRLQCKGVPSAAGEHVEDFIQDLVKNGLAGYELKNP